MPHFIDTQAAENFECVICLDIFKEPVQIGCNDHIFCKQCIMDTASNKRIYCPLCRVKCKTSSIRRVQFIDRQINQLMVKCPNHAISRKKAGYLSNKCKSPSPQKAREQLQKKKEDRDEDNDIDIRQKTRKRLSGRKRKRSFSEDTDCGDAYICHKKFKTMEHELCDWIGSLSELESHQKSCGLQLVSCKYCAVSMLHRDLKLHHEECTAFPIICTHCKQRDICRGSMRIHIKDECVMTHVLCPQKCGLNIRRKEVECHKTNTCPDTIIKCAFHRFGCLEEFKRKNEKKHIKDAVFRHNHLLGKKVVDLTQENAKFAVRIRAMEKSERNHKREMKAMRNEMISKMNHMQKKQASLRKMNHDLISRIESIEETLPRCKAPKKIKKRPRHNSSDRSSDWMSADSCCSSDSYI